MNDTEHTEPSHTTLIRRSWERCREFGLDHTSLPYLQTLSSGDLNNLMGEHRYLVQTTSNEVLPYYDNILSNSQCLILLTDSRGHLLNSWGDPRFLDTPHKQYFQQGVNWLEQYHGTNAIGTALATGQAVQIQRDEHFLKANRFMTGSASPIYNAHRDLLGVLDVSSDTYLPQAHTLGMVKLMAQSIENRLIINTFGDENFLLTFNTHLNTIDSPWSGLLVLNEDGVIISANRRAGLLLGQEITLAHISSIFDCPLQALKHHPETQPLELRALGKYTMHCLIKRPRKPVTAPADFRQPKPSASKAEGYIPLERISFGDPQVERCIGHARRIMEKDIPILIHGETGVGKEEFVKALHEQSSRNKYPLIAVNCAAIPGELVESELFGYEKGAFTGASSKGAIGLIRKAHKGTLFLDEIGEMPLKVQARLLRVLQERKVTPLGSTDSYAVDIKLISATNRSLREDVAAGQFRQDLYYRVSGLNLELPPLRHRTDRAALFREIHRLYRTPEQPEHLPGEILALFAQHPWPGNIRQLVSVIKIALALADDEPIQSWHLPDDFFADIRSQLSPDAKLVPPEQTAPPLHPNHSPIEVAHTAEARMHSAGTAGQPFIHNPKPTATPPEKPKDRTLDVYQQMQGNISRTARELGISRNTLYKRLRELGVK
ncbi:MAG: sigma-54-dependent Fis family transcriptional regulator [Gammaproteobacteria bacterium]|nr:MAG: sigma-54-dependent Fis family transcriptional regulator [Gammaproteobacteria bacterium]